MSTNAWLTKLHSCIDLIAKCFLEIELQMLSVLQRQWFIYFVSPEDCASGADRIAGAGFLYCSEGTYLSVFCSL